MNAPRENNVIRNNNQWPFTDSGLESIIEMFRSNKIKSIYFFKKIIVIVALFKFENLLS